MPSTLTYFCPADHGGIADYAREQAHAIAAKGIDVRFLAPTQFQSRPTDRYRLLPKLVGAELASPTSRLRARLRTAKRILANAKELSRFLAQSGSCHVLFASYLEYLAPLWAHRLRVLARRGVIFGAVVHDPVRHSVVGPQWWHRWSIAEGYSFLQEAFVHEPVKLDTIRSQLHLRTTVIPHGIFTVSAARKTSSAMRAELAIPVDAKVLLAFGHIRDNKNLDVAMRALRTFEDLFLVVAGQEVPRQRPLSYYRSLANELGLSGRCRWCTGFIPEAEVANYFQLADIVLLTYNGRFRSASGVLNIAVAHRKPCIASSGPSNLQTVVKEYGLGIWVEPDSEQALVQGLSQLISSPPKLQWDHYSEDHSWSRNADLVLNCIFEFARVREVSK